MEILKLNQHMEDDMDTYKIITDSTTDITLAMVKELELEIIPFHFIMNGTTYESTAEEKGMKTKDFYDRLRKGEMSTTAQINSDVFTERFTPILDKGCDILYIAFSSGLSGTCQSAMIAKNELQEKYPERKIYVFDSLAASMGQGLLVYLASNMKKSGSSIDEVYKWLGKNVLKLAHWFTVEDLNHLKRGGRVSAGAALVGTMLGIKPVLHVDNEGHLVSVSKVRGRKQSLDALVSKMEETAINPAEQTVFISHGDSLEDAKYVEQMLKEKLGVKKIFINYIGPIIGAHSGPGTIALFFIGKER